MKTRCITIGLLIALIAYPGFSQSWKTYPYTPSGSLITFPKDEGRHANEPVEWWYTTGHVIGNTSGINYSYMLTYFYFPQAGFDGFRILNISNDDTGAFFNDTKLVNYSTLATDKLHIEAAIFSGGTETWKNKINTNGNPVPFEYMLAASSSNTALNFQYIALKPPLIIDGDGLFNQGASSYTYYYSQTKNEVSGTITINGNTESVTGSSWIDRQYGSFNPFNKENYEWLSIQLSNNMDINVWNIFTESNTIPNQLEYKLLAAYVDDTTQYTHKDFHLERLAYKCTPDKVQCYSQQWKLTSTVNNIDLTITALHSNSEMQFPFRFYEGATTITGTVNGIAVSGVGFAELLHSYENPSLSFTYPTSGFWNVSEPITWQLANPDDGRPITYDIEYSIDNQASFIPIQQGISETSFLWNNATVNDGDIIWFKIKGYSTDNTLKSEVITDISALVTPATGSALDKNNVKIYPNPSQNKFTVSINSPLNLNYQIIDMSGRLLIADTLKNIEHFEVDTRNLAPGVYFIRLQSDNQKLVSKVIVK
jgi:predicted secreted hydrolase